MGAAAMTNNQVISISDGVRKPKPKRIQATKLPSGLELPADLVPDSMALLPAASMAEAIHFTGCSPGEDRNAVMSVSSLEELTTLTRDWRLPQLVNVWNQIQAYAG